MAAIDTLMGDPYAGIRTLGPSAFQQLAAQTYEDDSGIHEVRGAGTQFGDDTSWMGGFQSKYNDVRDLGDGRIAVKLQNPNPGSTHKYDTIEAIYARGPDGSWVMQGTPTPTREVSSGESMVRDPIENMAPIILAVAGGAYGAGGFGGADAAGAAGWEAGGAWGSGADVGAGAAGASGAAGGSAGASGVEPLSTQTTAIPEVAAGPGSAVGAAAGGGAAGAAGSGSMSWFDWAQLASGALQAHQARRATDAQVGAARDATALQERMFNTTNEQQAPYRLAGYAALGDLMGLRGGPSMTAEDVMAEPGYEFGRAQGMRGIENSAAARGMGLSGAALKDASRFNSNYASTRFGDAWNRRQADFGNRWGRLASLAGIGQTATQQTSRAGQLFGQQAGNNMIGAGNAIGAGAITRGNIWGNTLNQGLSMYGRNRNTNTPNPYATPNNWQTYDTGDGTGPY